MILVRTMNAEFALLTSDTARTAYIRDKLVNNERWMLRGMYAIWKYQTADEQRSECTHDSNGVGFSGIDGEIMTSFSNQMLKKGYLNKQNHPDLGIRMFFSEKQEKYVRKYMPRYARQLCKIATGKI